MLPAGAWRTALSSRLLSASIDRRLVARHRCSRLVVAQRQLDAARYRQRREFGDHRHRDAMQIDKSGEIERYLLKPSHREHLPDEPRHAVGVVAEFGGLGLIGKFVDPRRQHREGRAECVRGVADEAALRVERLFEPAERRIHRADQRQDLSWQAFRRAAGPRSVPGRSALRPRKRYEVDAARAGSSAPRSARSRRRSAAAARARSAGSRACRLRNRPSFCSRACPTATRHGRAAITTPTSPSGNPGEAAARKNPFRAGSAAVTLATALGSEASSA